MKDTYDELPGQEALIRAIYVAEDSLQCGEGVGLLYYIYKNDDPAEFEVIRAVLEARDNLPITIGSHPKDLKNG